MLDAQRELDPDWYRGRDLLGMLMYVDAFAGTLRGVREKLGYLQEAGVNYLHLMPLLESPARRPTPTKPSTSKNMSTMSCQ